MHSSDFPVLVLSEVESENRRNTSLKLTPGAGEMTLWLKVPFAFAEYLS